MDPAEALLNIWRKLRADDMRGGDGLTPQEAAALLCAIGVPLAEIEGAMRAFGDL